MFLMQRLAFLVQSVNLVKNIFYNYMLSQVKKIPSSFLISLFCCIIFFFINATLTKLSQSVLIFESLFVRLDEAYK